MKKEEDQTSEGLNQLFEIINTKDDVGDMREIVKDNPVDSQNKRA